MRFFKRKNSQATAIPEDLQPYYSPQKTGLQRWVGPILRAILLLVILGLLVWGGIALVHHITKSNDKKSTSQTTSQAKADQAAVKAAQAQAAKDNAKKATPSPASAPTPSPAAKSTPAPTPSTPSPAPTAAAPAPSPTPAASTPSAPADSTDDAGSSTLVNTGPGSVVALFAVVSVAGALLHRFVATRKTAA